MKTAVTFLASVLAAQQVAATWGSGDKYSNPANTDNECNDSQKKGWNWGDLDEGDFSSYGDHDFDGFKCSNGFGKRDSGLVKRWGNKCITGEAGAGKGPSIACGKDKKGFSINKMHVQTEEDHDVEFHYKMPDGSTCKQTTPCKAGGNIVQNEQCGGAETVSFHLPKTATKSCSIGVYSVGFDCSTASTTSTPPSYTPPSSSPPAYPTTSSESTPPVYSTSTPETSPSVPSYSKPTETPSTSTKPSVPVYSSPSVPLSTGPSYSKPSSSAPSSAPSSSPSSSVPSYSSPSSSAPSSSPSSSVPSYSAPSSSAPSSSPSVPSYSKPSVPLSTGPSSTPNSPVTPSSPNSYPSVPLSTGPSSSPNSPVTPSSSSATTSYTPVPSGNCPNSLPKCLNSWLWQSGCKDNGDYGCYCKQADFASKVCDCLTAYGADEEEATKAIAYFQGICSEYVGENYGLALSCNKPQPGPSPSGSAPVPSSPVPSSNAPSSTPNSPVSIPETQTTEIVTHTVTTCPVGYTVTSGSVTTTLSTPSVSTIYSTTTSTICTKCTALPSTTPAGPILTHPIESTPAGSTPAGSTPAAPTPAVPSSSPAAPVYPGPQTTISVSKTYQIPATYSTGESVGLTIPSSSVPTVVATSYTVPQVAITPGAGSSSGSLVYGPAPTPANTTPAGPVAGQPSKSGFGTTYTPKGTSAAPASTFTGAANVNNVAAGSFGGIILAGLAMVL